MRSAGSVGDIAVRMLFEREARLNGLYFCRRTRNGELTYRVTLDVPVWEREHQCQIGFGSLGLVADPRVMIDGPACTRHRYGDRSLCMWWRRDETSRRWTPSEGLYTLVAHIRLHAFCEAECRAGKPWPKDEAPGRHPRPRTCPSCRGRGR